MKIFLLVLFALVSEALRLILFGRLGIYPDLLLGVLVLVALSHRRPAGPVAGFVLGAIRDMVSGGTLGFETMMFTVFGWIVGNLGRSIYREAFSTQVILILIFGLVRGALTYLYATNGELAGLPLYALTYMLPSVVLTALICPLIFKLLPRPRPRMMSEHEKKIFLQS
ncbi:MAG: rod shape-determining protein MreD [Candidatus Eisenbacteria bacterium]|uniref:Rod shape-determining protein MreD n=1 Tax=Eiseniibacteriota bacterium TaxID=2212470 RepID=A0A7Y2E877_UNCEI|nr:rod shape-determining protein MreD [Candidatus Eisenbacteria bacterium]